MILADQCRRGLCLLAALACLSLTEAHAGAPPLNDRFADAIPLAGAPVSATGSTAEATHEPGEPVVPGNTAGQPVWWTWTAPGDGLLTLTVAEDNYSTALAVFDGADIASLQLLGSNQSIWGNFLGHEVRMRPQLSVTVTAGHPYHIAADWNSYVPVGSAGAPIGTVCPTCPPPILPPVGGPVAFTLGFVPAPANDSLANARGVSGNQAALTADTTGSSREPGEPDGLFHTVWWRWTAPRSGLLDFGTAVPAPKPAPTTTTMRARLPVPTYNDPLGWPAGAVIPIGSPTNSGGGWDNSGSIGSVSVGVIYTYNSGTVYDVSTLTERNPLPPFTPAVRLFTGPSLGELQLLAGGPLAQTNHARVEGGQTYYFALGSLTDAMGPAAFQFQLTAPENDNFADRMTITGVEAAATGHTVGATVEPGEPALSPASHSTWWTWTAPDDCVAEWSVAGTNFLPFLVAYHGSSLTTLQRVATGGGGLTVRVAQGDVLQLEVLELPFPGSPAEGDYTLTLKAEPIAPELAAVPQKRTDGSQQFRVNHLRGRGILIYAAANFGGWPGWQPLWAGVVNADSATFVDHTAVGVESRYYLVRLAQPGDEKWFIPPPPPVIETNAPPTWTKLPKPVHPLIP